MPLAERMWRIGRNWSRITLAAILVILGACLGCQPTDNYVRVEFLQTRPAEVILAEQGKEAQGGGIVSDFADVVSAAAPFAGALGGWGVGGLAVVTLGSITTGGIEKFGETNAVVLRAYIPAAVYNGFTVNSDPATGRWTSTVFAPTGASSTEERPTP